MNKIIQWLKRWKRKGNEDEAGLGMPLKRNPYLPCIRDILQQVLDRRGLNYGTMRLLVIDTELKQSSMQEDGAIGLGLEHFTLQEEDEVRLVLERLSEDLNFLTILTGRPEYFQEYVETMYEENGLLVHVEEKGEIRNFDANTVLDFERKGGFWNLELTQPSIYLPIYKRGWETLENLDICVPIGYNTVIVKGIKKEEGCYNRYGKEKYLDL